MTLIYLCEVPVYSSMTLDYRCEVPLYSFMKSLSTEICLSLFLGMDFRDAEDTAERIVNLTTTHWHGISLPGPGITRFNFWMERYTDCLIQCIDSCIFYFYIIGIISVPVSIKLPLAGGSSFCKALEAKVTISTLVWWIHYWSWEINVCGFYGLPLPQCFR